MYSLVMMMALSTSADVPALGHGYRGCNGCQGGCQGAKAGCDGAKAGCDGAKAGCNGAKAGCHGCFGGLFRHHHACNGCTGGHGCTGGKPAEKKEEPKKGGVSLPAPATLVVSLPNDAKLTIDDNPTRSISTVRTFVTPALERGRDFQYTLKVEVVRDGQTYTASKRVVVRGGQETRVELDVAVASVAQK